MSLMGPVGTLELSPSRAFFDGTDIGLCACHTREPHSLLGRDSDCPGRGFVGLVYTRTLVTPLAISL